MPYIVATKRPARADWARFAHASVSRLAVATLEEARDECVRIADAYPGPVPISRVLRVVESMDESGGTVGPLPDGTVIEVRPWPEEVARAWANFYGPPSASPLSEILDAYNAQQKAAA